jgi:hypothetical protein
MRTYIYTFTGLINFYGNIIQVLHINDEMYN